MSLILKWFIQLVASCQMLKEIGPALQGLVMKAMTLDNNQQKKIVGLFGWIPPKDTVKATIRLKGLNLMYGWSI